MNLNHKAGRSTYPPRRAFVVFLLTTHAAVDKSRLAIINVRQRNSQQKEEKMHPS